MQIIKRVLIKQVITEKSKQRLREKFQTENASLIRECQQLQFEERKLTNKLSGFAKQQIQERFEREISTRKEQIKINEFKLEQIDIVTLGSEIIEEEVDALVEVNIGDAWDKISKDKSIIIEDNIVIRIDNE